MSASLREKQTAALKRMLTFNSAPTKQVSAEPQWKILVYDRFGQDIISPLLNVKELRDLGVTLHLLLHTDRDPIPDVPAIYFVMPTDENVQRICRIFDQYLNFICLEDDLFTMRHQERDAISYYGMVPIIRSPRGNAAERVAEKLDKKLRDNIRDARNSLFTTDSIQAGQFSFQRPLLVILDRNLDLVSLLHHTWTYQALSHDVLEYNLNKVEIEENSEVISPSGSTRPRKKKKNYAFSFTDKFWQTHKGSSLPELLEKKRLIDMHTNIATALLEHIKSEEKEYCDALKAANCDITPVRYINRWKMFSKLMNQGSQFVMEGVKNLVVKKHNLPVTRIVDALMEMKSLPEVEDFRYFDPKLLRGDGSSVTRNKSPFQELVALGQEMPSSAWCLPGTGTTACVLLLPSLFFSLTVTPFRLSLICIAAAFAPHSNSLSECKLKSRVSCRDRHKQECGPFIG
ncbi:SCFD1 [Acanthosepion pharaonis]|uniref:SCFD1 n=1 Tax=Acanthosepion pharaonis TaxID=158019 RepID=A0A812EU22_ACAPH|nr:SCFD1 [Sepia pharaonis]